MIDKNLTLEARTNQLALNCWYPILDTHQIPKKGRILKAKRLGIDLILWKSEPGNLVCMEDRCAHKGVPLSLGNITRGSIRCQYHGLCYNQVGECIHAPVLGLKRMIPKSLRVRTFNVRINFGFVWIWWGDKSPHAEIPFFPEISSEERYAKAVSVRYPVSFHRVMESNIDGYHIDHLHKFWSPGMGPVVHASRVTVQGQRIDIQTEYRKTSESPSLEVTHSLLYPNLVMTLCNEWKLKNVIACSPMDDTSTWFMIRFFIDPTPFSLINRFLTSLLSIYTGRVLLPQDFLVQSQQKPKDLGMGFDHPLFPADLGVMEYWKMLQRESNASLSISGGAANDRRG
jgi:nitrite reductase/ring-hydroxylating ferredoxin subunit